MPVVSPALRHAVRHGALLRSCLLSSVFGLGLASAVLPQSAWAQQASQTAQSPSFAPMRFAIPAQPLSSALTRFADTANLRLLFPSELVGGLSSPGVEGTLSPDAALARLLAGTGLAYRFTGPTTVTIERAASDSATLPTVRVEDTVHSESAYGPVYGYLATRSATGSKTDTPIMELPASVQVVPRQVIEEQGALSLKDVYENVSGVAQAGNTLNAQTEVLPIIRGFQSPTLLRNGLRSTQSGAVDLTNVERVEVLKGPASILYGTLDPGGVINYVTKRPQETPSFEIDQEIGSFNFMRSTLDATGPIGEDDSLFYRLNFAYTDSESFRDSINLKRTAFAPSVLWKPSDQTEFLVDFSYLRERQPYDAGVPLGLDGKPLAPKETFFGDPDLAGRTIEDTAISYQLSHRVDSVWSFRNQLQLHRAEALNEALRPRSVSGTIANPTLLLRYQNEDRTDDELQFVFDATAKFATGAIDHTLLLGSEYIMQDTDFFRFRQNVPGSVTITPNPTVNFTPPANQTMEPTLSESNWVGFYAQDQMAMLEDRRLKFLLGGRFDIVHQENAQNGVATPNIDDQAFSARTGLLYDFTKQLSAYASISQSFKPQSNGTLDRSGQPLDPETGLQYEIGVKHSFFDNRLMATAALFQIEKENVAVFDQAYFNSNGVSSYLPDVKQQSRGFEFDISGAITDEINIIANYAYIETEVLENPIDASNVGDSLGGVPTQKARIWLTYEFKSGPLSGFGFGGGPRYVSESTAQFDTTIKLDPYTVVDLGAWYRWEGMKAGLNVYNLLDRDYIARASDRSIAHPGQPLAVIGSISFSF